MDRCIVTVTEEQCFPTSELKLKLKRHYDVVQFMPLGSLDFIEHYASKHESTLSPLNLSNSLSNYHIFVTSFIALLELGNTLRNFKDVTFWLDPQDSHFDRQLAQNSTSQSVLDLVRSTTCEALCKSSSSALVARTEAGKLDWKRAYGISVPLATENFITEYNDALCEPLIEKRDQQRFLIEASSCHTSVSLVEPFLVLQENCSNIEIWCNFDGELPLWMRPDFLIQNIPSTEAPLYTNSVDALVCTGNTLSQRKTIQYMSLGLMPIVIDKQLAEQLDKIIDTTAIRASFPSFGSENLLQELAESPEKLNLYNSYSKADLKSNILFDSNEIARRKVPASSCTDLLQSNIFNSSRELYLESAYGEREGTQLHHSLELSSRHLGTLTGQSTSLVLLQGWCLDITTQSEAQPLTLLDGAETPSILRRHDRADVTDAFNLSKDVPVGFDCLTIVKDEQPTNRMKLAISGDGSKLAKFDAFEQSLKPIVNLSEPREQNPIVADKDRFKGVLEKFESTDVIAFDLTSLKPAFEELVIKLKDKENFRTIENTDLYLATDDQFKKLDSHSIDESNQFVKIKTDVNSCVCYLYVHVKGPTKLDDGDIACHVFYATTDLSNKETLDPSHQTDIAEDCSRTTLET